MGYVTWYVMTLVDLRPGPGRRTLDAEFLNELEFDRVPASAGEWRTRNDSNSYEFGERVWENHDTEVRAASLAWPDVVFVLDGDDEDDKTWRKFYWNGRCQPWARAAGDPSRWLDEIISELQPVGPSAPPDDATGFNVAPARYSKHGRETIDRIRDRAGTWFRAAIRRGLSADDAAFVTVCRAAEFKYTDRAGLKGSEEEDLKKATFYDQMARHVEYGDVTDPREYRAEFAPYERPADSQQPLHFPEKES